MIEYTDNPNAMRFSFVSCMTEDSVDSNGLNTPADASPRPPLSNTFSIINIVNDDPLPNTKRFPDIASSNGRRAQTTPRPGFSNIVAQPILEQQPAPTFINEYENSSNSTSKIKSSPVPNSSKFTRLWPKFKQSVLAQTDNKFDQPSNNNNKSKNWFGKNRARVGSQR